VFAVHGLSASDYCTLLPILDLQSFSGAMGRCDVVLDSIGWSGCNSTLESLVHDLPIVTIPGPLMRGRHTLAILTMMGVTRDDRRYDRQLCGDRRAALPVTAAGRSRLEPLWPPRSTAFIATTRALRRWRSSSTALHAIQKAQSTRPGEVRSWSKAAKWRGRGRWSGICGTADVLPT
jgi:hypothetical protein